MYALATALSTGYSGRGNTRYQMVRNKDEHKFEKRSARGREKERRAKKRDERAEEIRLLRRVKDDLDDE